MDQTKSCSDSKFADEFVESLFQSSPSVVLTDIVLNLTMLISQLFKFFHSVDLILTLMASAVPQSDAIIIQGHFHYLMVDLKMIKCSLNVLHVRGWEELEGGWKPMYCALFF